MKKTNAPSAADKLASASSKTKKKTDDEAVAAEAEEKSLKETVLEGCARVPDVDFERN
jgi:hypothetical protein